MLHTFVMSFIRTIHFTCLLLLVQSASAAEPAFEAYYKFLLGEQHVGYVVQRLDIEAPKNIFTSTYYAYVKTPSGSTTESLVAKADSAFEPISYQYSALVDGVAKSAEGTFKNKKMSGRMTDGKKVQSVNLTTPPNGFLSTFINYVILKNGLMVGKNYKFTALAEETPACFNGDAACNIKNTGFMTGTAGIIAEQKFKEIPAYKIKFNFKDIEFIGILSATGEILASISPQQSAATEIVKTKEEAVANFPFNEKHLTLLFGSIPQGKKNSLTTPGGGATGAKTPDAGATGAKPPAAKK